MKTRYTLVATIIVLLGIGFAIWKIFSKPLPTSDTIVEIEPGQSAQTTEKTNFQELIVGGKSISPGDLAWEMDLHTKIPQLPDQIDQIKDQKSPGEETTKQPDVTESPELRERIVTSVIERKVLYQFIAEKAKGFDLSDPSRFTKCVAQVAEVTTANPDFFSSSISRERLKTKLCEQSIIEQYLEEHIFRPISVTGDEITSYYRTHEKNFKKPTRIKLRQIVLAKEDTASELRKEIKPSNFEYLARKHSITPEAEEGGLIGPFSKEQLPTLFDIVFSMDIGEISGVIKSEYGFHIIMPTERIPPQTLSLAEATPEIRAELLRTKKLDAFQRWLNSALNAISVTSPNSGISP